MEFRRAEIKRVYRHVERLDNPGDIRALMEAIMANNLRFSAKIRGVSFELRDCVLASVGEGSADIVVRAPARMRLSPEFDDIQSVEIVCNKEIVAEEGDDGGRWARII